MDNFSFFHLCNHRIRKSNRDGEIRTLVVENSRDLVDIIINGAVVLEIIEVRAIEYDTSDAEIEDFYYDNPNRDQTYDDKDPGDSYYDEAPLYIVEYGKYFTEGQKVSRPLPPSFYEPTLHNRIRWIVKPPRKYQVQAKVKYTVESFENYNPADCPVCGGKGWFVDILDSNGQFAKPTGIIKVAQRVVKDFLTEVGTQVFDPTYGTRIKKEAMDSSSDDDMLFNYVRTAVSEVEDRYLTDQQEIITDLPPDETLLSLSVEDVYRMEKRPTSIVIQLRINTQTDEQIFKFGY